MNKSLALTFSLAFILLAGCGPDAGVFKSGRPVWPRGLEKEMNLFAGFRAVFALPVEHAGEKGGEKILRVAASTLYRVFLNGRFLGHGPARGPHGFYRVDEWDLAENLLPGKNLLAIEVAGYNVDGYYLLDQPSFLQAEVVAGGRVLASTAGSGSRFTACILNEHVRKVQRYTTQRTFSEVYRLRPGYDLWRIDPEAEMEKVECALQPEKKLLPRRVPYSRFSLRQPAWDLCRGRIKTGLEPDKLWRYRSLTDIGPKLLGFKEEQLEVIPSIKLQKIANTQETEIGRPFRQDEKISLSEKSYHTLDFGTNLTGFIGARVTVHKPTRLFITFDEELTGGDVDFKRLNAVNIVSYELQEGSYEIESFEPYTLRYLKFTVLDGDCDLEGVCLREYVNPDAGRAHFASSDDRLNRLFEAGRETFRQNATDIFMDCPSRERAGWLCDSYFTARVAVDLCGSAVVEKNFFENYLLPDSFACIPEGMLPMCYPADHLRGSFIPNWALWFVLQLEEYALRSGDIQTVEALKSRVMNLFDYFNKFKNEDGLLERLEGWVLIEWSKTNEFTQDVNYPSNMLYAMALDAAARMYGLPGLAAEAAGIRKVVREQSFDGEFFVDNALRQNGKLQPTRNRTETCQYYAFLSGTATPESHPELLRRLAGEFGLKRKENKSFAEIAPITPFIGYLLRLECLSRWGFCREILDESIDYYLEMADQTGTLWELRRPYSSRNHGFASHICRTLYRDILGLYRVDPVRKEVALRFSDPGPEWCEGRVPTPGGEVRLKWWTVDDRIYYRVQVPAGFKVSVENSSGRELIPRP
ncbi:MAG: hypothetical protein U9P14_04035 [Gemmatimonadota bacterium]|nr:hypothetical protein [Gemmatimonadota bacterium]